MRMSIRLTMRLMINTTPITLPYGYTPRPYQIAPLQALDKGAKRLIWVMHRRGGKDLTIFNWVVKTIAVGQPKTVWYVFPTYSQAKMVIWDGMTKDGRKYLDYIPECLIAKKNQQELKITFNNGSTFRLIGSDNVDRLVGAGPHIVVFSEASLHDPRAWEYIRPMIVETDGIAIFIGTPRGKNKFYEMFLHAQSDPDWFAQLLTIEDTKAVSQDQVDKERHDGMSEEMILQEYYCSWDSSIEGAYYSRILSTMRKSGQIGVVPYNPDLLVYTCWDLGFTDSMVITYFQKHGEAIRIIDHYENHGYQLSHYLQELKKKPYIYGGHFAPHDGAAHDRAGNTFIQKAREYGVDFTLLQDRYTILEGIEKVRSMLNNTYIDMVRCERLILCLEHYRSEYDPIKQSYNKKPLHDFSSHSADCIRYLAQAVSQISISKGMTADDIYRLRAEAEYQRDRAITPNYKKRF